MRTGNWLHPLPTTAHVEAESRLLCAQGSAEYLRGQVQRTDLSDEQRADIVARIGRLEEVAAEQARIVKKERGW